MSLRPFLRFCLFVVLLGVVPFSCTPQLPGLDLSEGETSEPLDSESDSIEAGAGSETILGQSSGDNTGQAQTGQSTRSLSQSDAGVSSTPTTQTGNDASVDGQLTDAALSTAPASQVSGDAAVGVADAQSNNSEDEINILASSPVNGDSSVAVDALLRLTFDRAVVAGTGAIRLVTEDGMDVAFELDGSDAGIEIDGAQVSIPWGITLGYATWYWVEIAPDAFVGADGAGFAGLHGDTLRFQTQAPLPIELQATFPEGSSDAELEPTLTLVFNVDVVSATIGDLSIYEVSTGDEVGRVAISDATQVEFDGGQVNIHMGLRLAHGTAYYVLLDAGAIVSTRGAVFEGIDDVETFTFVTIDAPKLVIIESSPVQVDTPASGVALTPAFVFTFNESIAAGSGAFSVYQSTADALAQQVDIDDAAVSIQGATLTIALPAELAPETNYYLVLAAGLVEGSEGGVFAGIEAPEALVFTTAAAAIPNVILASSDPADGAVDVSVNTTLEFTFDVAVQANQGSVSLHDADSGATIVEINIASGSVDFDGNTMSVGLTQVLPGATEIAVHISPGAVVGTDGAPFPGLTDDDFTFETESSFGVVGRSPFEVQNVDPAAHLVLSFSAAVAVGTGTIEISDSGGPVESISLPDARVTVAGSQATIDLDNILASDTAFEVQVDAGAFVEAGGNGESSSIGPGTWTFETAAVAAPAGIGSGLILWLDAAYAPSVKGTAVSVWADRSGQYRNVVQTDNTRRPALVGSSMNGRAVVRFDGSNDVLRGLELTNSSNLDGFIVWRSATPPSDSTQRTILVNDATFELNHSHPYVPSSLASCVGDDCPESQWYSALFEPLALANATQVWNFGYSSSDTSIFARANAGATETQTGPSAPPSAATTPLRIGGEPANCSEGCYFGGDVAEVLLYSTPLTADQELDVLAYLYDKWRVGTGTCGVGEERGPSGKCYVYDSTIRTWQDARNACLARGAGWDLAEVRNELDHRFLMEEFLASTSANVWLGAQVADSVDTWRWLSDDLAFWVGRSLGQPEAGLFAPWRSDQPNDGGSAVLCLRYRFENDTWGWSDANCTTEPATAICEGPAD